MDREIQEKQTKIEYVRSCANYLLSKTVDARGLTINMNELTKFCQQLRDLTKRIQKLKQKLMNTTDVKTYSLSPFLFALFSSSYREILVCLHQHVHRRYTIHSIQQANVHHQQVKTNGK